MPSEFFIYNAKFQELSDDACDWFLKSCKFKERSLERQVCLLRQKICWREAKKYLKKVIKITERKLNGI